ncbi:MAG: helix-turn-helix domain-containing protein [Bdellovibrionota bacterium]
MATKSYKKWKRDRLQDNEYAAMYLHTSLEESLKDHDYESFLLALKYVIEANGSVQEVAKKANITRQHLHRLIQGKGNPTIQTLAGILKAVGISIDLVPNK